MPPPAGASFAACFPAAPRAVRDRAMERERAKKRASASPAPLRGIDQNGRRHTAATTAPAAPTAAASLSRPEDGFSSSTITTNIAFSSTTLAPAPASHRTGSGPGSVFDAAHLYTDDSESLPGDILNAVGSASSHASTSSSVFSSSALPPNAMAFSKQSSSHVTPLTNVGSPTCSVASSYPTKPLASTPTTTDKADGCPSSSSWNPTAATNGTLSNGGPLSSLPSLASTSSTATAVERVPARDPTRAVKGIICTYDPLLDRSALPSDKKKGRPTYKEFGTEDDAPPTDPRLAKGGRLNYINVDFHLPKARLRHAPYNIKPYPYDPRTAVGPGPPTQIVVVGFNPLITFSKVTAVFGSFGEIAESSNKMHPETGSYLGFATFRYKDSKPSRSRPMSVTAIDAAKRAVRQMNGQRIEAKPVRVEYDPDGRKSGRMMEEALKQDKEKMSLSAPLKAPSGPKPSVAPGPLARPPPTAPRAPAAHRLPPGSIAGGIDMIRAIPPPPPPSGYDRQQVVLSANRREPYIFIAHKDVPVMSSTIAHMKRRLKAYRLDDIRLDRTGYFIMFPDSIRGRGEAVRCFEECNGVSLFNYTMIMHYFPFGKLGHPSLAPQPQPAPPVEPKRRRSPSPSRKLSIEIRPRDDKMRRRREEEADLEEEKKQRAKDFDPVMEAVLVVRRQMTEQLIKHIRTKVAIPALVTYLDPSNHVAKRRRLNLEETHGDEWRPSIVRNDGNDGEEKSPISTPNARADPIERRTARLDVTALPRIRKIKKSSQAARKQEFVDPFGRNRAPVVRKAFRSLHHRMFKDDTEDESEDEALETRDSLARDTEEPDSRPRSRMSTDDDVTKDDFGSWGPQEEDSMTESSFAVNEPPLLTTKKRKLDLQIETAIKRQRKSDEELFGVTIDKIEDEFTAANPPASDDILLPDAESILGKDETDSSGLPTPAVVEVAPKKKAGKKKKTKKQIFEEREALRKAQQQVYEEEAAKEEIETPVETPTETPIETPAKHVDATPTAEPPKAEPMSEETAARLKRDSKRYPDSVASALELPPDFALDITSLNALRLGLKDRPDVTRLRRTFKDSNIGDPELWLWRKDRVRSLNSADFGASAAGDRPPRIEGYYVSNPAGCARAEGVKKILNSEKSKYLPHHIKVKKAREERQAKAKTGGPLSSKTVSAVKVPDDNSISRGTSRANRANQRRVIAEINDQKKTLGQDSDVLRFNQLKKRKKPVKFARSAIHNWGLYAMEDILKDDMIIEYVGEEVRPSVAQVREKRYLKSGIGSSYLFRIDEDAVIDATKKGGIARFINHSCMPNCTAKIIKVEGSKRIVIYALRDISQNEELTYDYKFEPEEDERDRVPCLCGTTACKGFLN